MNDEPPTSGLAPGALVGERYRLLRVIGTGGMGAVFEGERVDGSGGRIAIKALTTSGGWIDAQQRARFIREAEVLAQLKSPNIVPVVDHGIDAATGTPYLVMPLLVGDDLGTIVARLGALEPEVAIRLFIQACRGLQAAHAAGVIHRDVKPSNLFVETQSSGAGAGTMTLKVCDFGLAKVFDQVESLTRSGAFLGTPHYVSPEQATNAKRVDARSDVWGAAMSLYHALAGAPAFAHIDNVAALVFELTAGNMRPLQDVAPWIAPQLARIVHASLLLDPALRCPSTQELARALTALVGDETNLTTLSTTALQAASEATRAEVAPRVEIPHAWSDVAAAPEDDPDDSSALVGATLGGRYHLEKVIGRGGMGAVYEAKTEDGACFALKVIRPEIARRSRDAMRRFVREARTAATISNDHVTKVVDAAADDSRNAPYIVMELLRGADLGALMREKGALEAPAVVTIFIEACKGLAAAHALGIVHRDIKPANIFLHEGEGRTVTTKLCDFGVAKHTAAAELEEATTDLTRTGGMLGSPIYMSPEQAQNAKNVDHRTDLWSLAITLHQALSGQRPWQGSSTMGELILAICTREVALLHEVAPWVDPELSFVVHRALKRNVADRCASAEELAAALAPFAMKEPLTMAALVAVPGDRRATSTPPIARTVSSASALAGSISTDAHVSTGRRTGRSSRLGKRSVVVAGAALALGIAGGAVSLSRWSAKPHAATETTLAPPPLAARIVETASPLVRVSVPVHPPTARVTVAGVVRELVDGMLTLEGKPGESFVVVLEHQGTRHEVPVAITSDGRAVPYAIEAPTMATAPSTAQPTTSTKATRPLPNAPPAVSAPSSAMPAPSASSLPELKRSW